MKLEARCKACEKLVAFDPVNLQVNEWVGSWPGLRWQVVGWCPDCGDLVLSVWFRYRQPVVDLIDAGVGLVELEEPRELFEIRVRARARRLNRGDVCRAVDVLADDRLLWVELDQLVARYGAGS